MTPGACRTTYERQVLEDLAKRVDSARSFAEVGGLAVETLRSSVGVNGVNVCPMVNGAVLQADAVMFHEAFSQDHMVSMVEEFVVDADREMLFGREPSSLFEPIDCVEDVDFRSLERSRVFNEFYRPHHIERQVLCFTGSGTHPSGFVCMSRALEDRAFSAPERRMMAGVAKQVSAFVDRLRDDGGWSAAIEILAALEQTLPTPCAVFDDQGLLRWWNEAARRRLAAASSTHRGTVVHSVQSAKFHAWRDMALQSIHGLPQRPTVEGDVSVMLARHGTAHPLAVVVGRSLRSDCLTALTPRERQVVTLIVEGLSVLNVASRLAIGEETVRTHIKRIYAKLQVSSRAQLVAKIMGVSL